MARSSTHMPPAGDRPPGPSASVTGERQLFIGAIILFALAASITVYFCRSMAGGMAMPGGWTMSMMWMPMGNQSWAVATSLFLAMWLAMMIAMMLPSALPTIVVYRRLKVFTGDNHATRDAVILTCGYFLVWLLFGIVAFAIGAALAAGAMRWDGLSRAVPKLFGSALVTCGAYQLTSWKSVCLRHCRDPLTLVACHASGGVRGAWKLGIHHGFHCGLCCWALMLIQLVLGVMSLWVMAAVGVIITLEKLLPGGMWIARCAGVAAIAGGAWMIIWY